MEATTLANKGLEIPCPRCGKPLADPGGLRWCKGCGYCKSREEDKAKVVLPQGPPPPNKLEKVVEAGKVVGKVPAWFYCLLLGIGVMVGATFIPGRKLVLTDF